MFSLVYWQDKALGEDAEVLLVHWEDRVFFFTSIPEIRFLTGILGEQVVLTSILGRRGLFFSILGGWWLFTGILGGQQFLTGVLGGWGGLLVYWEEGGFFTGILGG